MKASVFRRRSYLPWPVEVLVGAISLLLYRVRSRGAGHVPAKGGALLIANHLSYVDAVALQWACPRQLRFVGYRGDRANGFFDLVFRLAGVIPISARHPTTGLRRAIEALKAGELVCVFPEGAISRTGQLMRLQKGFQVMAHRAGVPVVPAAVDGFWGSVFSFSGNRYLWKVPRLMPTPVCVAFGRPEDNEKADTAWARRALLDLGAEAFAERPVLKLHLGREIVRALARRPGRVVVTDLTGERREVRAAQVLGAAAVLARRLRSEVPEERIGIVLPPGAGAMIANIAVICAGKIPVNINFSVSPQSIEAGFRLGRIRTVISAEAMRERLPQFPWPPATIDLRSALTASGGKRAILPWVLAAWILPNRWVAGLFRFPRLGDRSEAALLFTSGTSGEPKGVVLSHRNILANCAQVSSLSILPKTCTMLGCLPLFHSYGFTVTLWYPLLRGCRLVTVPSPLDTRKIIDAIRDEEVSVMIGAPSFLRPILKKAQSSELRPLKLVIAGAEKLPAELYRGFLKSFHLEILEGYGLTETAPATNVNQPDPPITTETAGPQAGKKAGTVGRLFPGLTARIVDPESGSDLPLTQTGLICLRGANVFSGYLGDEERTRAAIRDGWFVTGDIGYFDDDGFLTIAGRLSRFSKIAGEMVPHGVVEQKIAEVFALDLSEGPLVTVMGVPDPVRGESLVVLAACDLTLEAVRERLISSGLPNLWLPKAVIRVERIPVLGSGKLDLRGCGELARVQNPAFASAKTTAEAPRQ